MTIKQRIALLAGSLLLGLILCNGALNWALNKTRIGGQLYNDIVNDKDLLADILPPPEYIIEAYLTVYQLLASTDEVTRTEYGKRISQLEADYLNREKFWQTQSLGEQARQALTASQQDAHTFFLLCKRLQAATTANSTDAEAIKQDITQAYNSHRSHIDQLVTISNQAFTEHDELGKTTTHRLQLFSSTLAIAVILGGIAISLCTMRRITMPLDQLKTVFAKITATGDFSIRSQQDTLNDEIGELARNINELLAELQSSFQEITTVANTFADGNFGRRLNSQQLGDLGQLADCLDTSFAEAEAAVGIMAQLISAIKEGETVDPTIIENQHLKGQWLEETEIAFQALNDLNTMFQEITQVMQQSSCGHFNGHINLKVSGIYLALINAINIAMHRLNLAVSDIVDTTEALALGNLTVTVNGHHEGELLRLKNSLNQAITALSESFSQVLGRSSEILQLSGQVALANQDLSERLNQQACTLEQVTSTMFEITAQIQAATQQAEKSKSITLDAHDAAKTGAFEMQNAVSSMRVIREFSNQITGIIGFIDGIAFQSNLLALNAAVEAARAGENGRAFAVVAGEVRTLAQKSGEAAKDIKLLIAQTTDKIHEGTEKVESTEVTIERISSQVAQVGQLMEDISKSAHEQAVGVGSTSAAIREIDNNLQLNAALVEKNAQLAHHLDRIAQTLNNLAGQFKLQTNSHHKPASTSEKPKETNLRLVVNAKPSLPASIDNNDWAEF
ncbi:MAG: methyl-accepting chemotaxis protein [Methylococcaceae bacterium]|jgi:methyl-accepting chemotaxis protein